MGIITTLETTAARPVRSNSPRCRPWNTGGFLVIALGLALTLVAAGATLFAVIATATTSTTIALTALGVTISASPLDLFLAGALSVILLGLGFTLISRGTRRSARTHKELRSLRKDKAIAATKAAEDREDETKDDGAADDGTANSSRTDGADSSIISSTADAT
jgi:membrane protein implicated in regulation of membrane protease activity